MPSQLHASLVVISGWKYDLQFLVVNLDTIPITRFKFSIIVLSNYKLDVNAMDWNLNSECEN